jgi:hypothetical protein
MGIAGLEPPPTMPSTIPHSLTTKPLAEEHHDLSECAAAPGSRAVTAAARVQDEPFSPGVPKEGSAFIAS